MGDIMNKALLNPYKTPSDFRPQMIQIGLFSF
jgi:hypothetical protein